MKHTARLLHGVEFSPGPDLHHSTGLLGTSYYTSELYVTGALVEVTLRTERDGRPWVVLSDERGWRAATWSDAVQILSPLEQLAEVLDDT